ncbi:unnamed protein product [Victoria cruziana]
MPRLRLPSSSDEEEDSGKGVLNRARSSRKPEGDRVGRASRRLQILDSPDRGEEDERRGGFPIGPPAPPATAASTENYTVEISDDDDFIDVPDSFTPPSSSAHRAQDDLGAVSPEMLPESAILEAESGDSPVAEVLRAIGARPRREWLDSCIRSLADSCPGFTSLSVREVADLCLKQYLFADFNSAAAGGLPPNIPMLHGVEIGGPFILQVDEIVNVGSPLRDRYKEASSGNKRCLKLSMTDGIQRVFGIEYRPIKDLKVLAPAGLKVAVQNVHVRRGLLMLVAEVLEVLGGSVEYLDAARRRLVDEVNKPPRGRRRPRGEAVASLVEKARVAAWPPNMFDDLADVSSSEHLNIPPLTSNQATLSSVPTRDNQGRGSEASTPRSVTENVIFNRFPNTRTSIHGCAEHKIDQVNGRPGNEEEVHLAKRAHHAAIYPAELEGSSISNSVALEHLDTVGPSHQETASSRGFAKDVIADKSTIGRLNGDKYGRPSDAVIRLDSTIAGSARSAIDLNEHPGPSSTDHAHRIAVAESNSTLGPPTDVDSRIQSTDEVKHAMKKAHPNTEETALSTQGNIKCFLTGVKGFQFKGRSQFELRVYVDDGSLISEVLIDHSVVQNGIGYSAAEVTAALSSPDKENVAKMKAAMKRFQAFLAKFEGTMLMEISDTTAVPVALEMNQGCLSSDAWKLLRRLKLYTASMSPQCPHIPINISP